MAHSAPARRSGMTSGSGAGLGPALPIRGQDAWDEHAVRWRERLGGMTYAWSVECPLNDQGLVRSLVTAARESVFMCDSGGEI